MAAQYPTSTVRSLTARLRAPRTGSLQRRSQLSSRAFPKLIRQANVIRHIFPNRVTYSPLVSFRSQSNDFRLSGGWLLEQDDDFEPIAASPAAKMPIVHIVLFEFKPTITHAQVEDVRIYPRAGCEDTVLMSPQVCKRMLALPQKCLHPTSNQPYVKGHGGGRDNSPEGLQVVAAPAVHHRGTRR